MYRTARSLVCFVALVLLSTSVAVGCGGDRNALRASVVATIAFDEGTEPVALTVGSHGDLLIGERRTGRIRAVTPEGTLRPEPVAVVDVGARGQRGLLGLASIGERVFAAWTRATDARIVVAKVAPGAERLVWEGPASADRANGGHLAVAHGRLVIGIGDLLDRSRVANPSAPNGKMLSLDPDGSADQRPRTLSTGWNNPFAFTVSHDGSVWVADNAPNQEPERIGRGDRAGTRFDLPGARAPSGLVELAPGRFGLCGYLDGKLVEVTIAGNDLQLGETILNHGCSTGAARLADGSIAVSDATKVRIIRVP